MKASETLLLFTFVSFLDAFLEADRQTRFRKRNARLNSTHVHGNHAPMPRLVKTDASYGAIVATEDVRLKIDASFWIICLFILTGDTARGVLFPTLWPRVQSLVNQFPLDRSLHRGPVHTP